MTDDPHDMRFAFLGTSGEYSHILYSYMGSVLPDEDGDGVPDVIDNCPPSLCAAIGDGRSCANARQIDSDGDGIGDVCDICPTIPSPEDAAPDGKRVGDACGCTGFELDYLPCIKGSTTCGVNQAGTCLYDYDSGGNALPGLCSLLSDTDRDGIPDDCGDTCVELWDQQEPNSNIHIERERGVSLVGDVCEGVPLFPFQEVTISHPKGLVPTPGSGGLGVDVQRLRGYPWLGSDAYNTPIQQPVAFRHCSCIDEAGNEVDPEGCAESRCAPSGAEWMENNWVAATTAPSQGGAAFPASGFPAQFTAYEAPGSPTEMEDPFPPWEQRDTLYWKSYQDIHRTPDPVQGDPATGASYGLMASVVHHEGGQIASLRDATYELRTSLREVRTPLARENPFVNIQDLLTEQLLHICMIVDCINFIPVPLASHQPPQPFPFDPLALLSHEGTAAMLLRDGGFVDVSHYFDPLLVDLLSSREWVIISPEENAPTLRRTGLNRIGVLMPLGGTLGMKPLQVYDENGMIRLKGAPQYGASPEDLAESIQLHPGERAIYSATQDRLVIAGNGSSLRTYDIGGDRHRQIALDRSLSATVGGLALDTFSNKIYTLEVGWLDQYAQDMARIFEYRLGSGTSTHLFSVPWSDTYERTAIIADTADTLIVVGSKGELTESWRFLNHDGQDIEYIGHRVDEGRLFSEPHHSTRSAVLMLADELVIVELNHRGFFGGQALDEL